MTIGQHAARCCASDHQQQRADEVFMSRNRRNKSKRERMKASRADEGRGESCQHRTLAAIKQYFESQELCLFGDPKERYVGFDLHFYPPEAVTYRNRNGDAACPVIITACEDGQFVKIASQDAWNLRDCRHRAAVYETLVRETPELPIIRFQHDPESDGVTPFAIVTVDNRQVSGDLVQEGVGRVIHAIPRWDPVIRRVMETGEVSVPGLPDSGEGLSPEQVRQLWQGLVDRLTEDVEAKWQRIRQDIVAESGSHGAVVMSEQPHSKYLMGTAALFHGGRLLGLAPTLPTKSERILKSANQFASGVIARLEELDC
jgi:hypothetical protein